MMTRAAAFLLFTSAVALAQPQPCLPPEIAVENDTPSRQAKRCSILPRIEALLTSSARDANASFTTIYYASLAQMLSVDRGILLDSARSQLDPVVIRALKAAGRDDLASSWLPDRDATAIP